MSRVKENIVERFGHFIILGVVGIVSLVLLFMLVIKSPNTVSIKGVGKVGPGQIDKKIAIKAELLDEKLASDPEPKGRYSERFKEFENVFDMSLEGYESSDFPLPSAANGTIALAREYDLPIVGSLEDVQVSHVRTVAYVPLLPVTLEKQYDKVETTAKDLDFVTVEAKLDVTAVYEEFRDAFNSVDVQKDWRDPDLARVVFVRMQLQRQEQLSDDSWSEWQDVQRTSIDAYSEMMDFAETVDSLEKGVDILRLQFQSRELWANVLQPVVYDIAVAGQEWYPPSLYDEYLKEQKMLEREKLRAERETQREPDRRSRDTRSTRDRVDRRPSREDADKKPLRQELDIETKYKQLLIPAEAELDQLGGELAVWAHDDSVIPGKTYRYRMRLGVLNPVAGLGWYKDEYRDYNDAVILWSEYTEPTDPVAISGVEYIFPTKGTTQGIMVEVAKYKLGEWKTAEFRVNIGDSIGDLIEETVEVTTDDERDAQSTTEIREVDYRTGAVVLDIRDEEVEVVVAGSSRSVRTKILEYEAADGQVVSVPIGDRYWPQSLKDAEKEVRASKDSLVELVPRKASVSR